MHYHKVYLLFSLFRIVYTSLDVGHVTKICPTDEIWLQKAQLLPGAGSLTTCPHQSICDNPAVRDSTRVSPVLIRTIVHVIVDDDDDDDLNISQSSVDEQLEQINKDYYDSMIEFDYVTRWHTDNTYSSISAYSPILDHWSNEIDSLKVKYAETPGTALNIFMTFQRSSFFGTLLGIGTFPWDPSSLSSTGGLWLNAEYSGYGFKSASHEIGHCFGLWHNFHGVSEVNCNTECSEYAHSVGDASADTVGDFCSDTRASPKNYNCAEPSGSDCKNVAWRHFGTDYSNMMGYGPDPCLNGFTPQQTRRMHCYIFHGFVFLLFVI